MWYVFICLQETLSCSFSIALAHLFDGITHIVSVPKPWWQLWSYNCEGLPSNLWRTNHNKAKYDCQTWFWSLPLPLIQNPVVSQQKKILCSAAHFCPAWFLSPLRAKNVKADVQEVAFAIQCCYRYMMKLPHRNANTSQNFSFFKSKHNINPCPKCCLLSQYSSLLQPTMQTCMFMIEFHMLLMLLFL